VVSTRSIGEGQGEVGKVFLDLVGQRLLANKFRVYHIENAAEVDTFPKSAWLELESRAAAGEKVALLIDEVHEGIGRAAWTWILRKTKYFPIVGVGIPSIPMDFRKFSNGLAGQKMTGKLNKRESVAAREAKQHFENT